MLLTSAVILFALAGLLRSLRNGFYALHVLLVLAGAWMYEQRQAVELTPFSPEILPVFITLHLVFINLFVFVMYGYDKSAAKAGRWRIPERMLHAMTLVGGTFGAFLGQKIFRHKTRKSSFRIVFWLTGWLQVLLAAALYVYTR